MSMEHGYCGECEEILVFLLVFFRDQVITIIISGAREQQHNTEKYIDNDH